MLQLDSKLKWLIFPCLLSLGFTPIQGLEKNFDHEDLLCNQDFSIENVLRKKSSRSASSYGSFFNEVAQTITTSERSDRKIAFPNYSITPKNIMSNAMGTVFTIEKSGIYKISYSFSLGTESIGTGSIALDINQQKIPIPGSQVFIEDVFSHSFSRTIQMFLKKGQTLAVNYFNPTPGDVVVIKQANITFQLIDEK